MFGRAIFEVIEVKAHSRMNFKILIFYAKKTALNLENVRQPSVGKIVINI